MLGVRAGDYGGHSMSFPVNVEYLKSITPFSKLQHFSLTPYYDYKVQRHLLVTFVTNSKTSVLDFYGFQNKDIIGLILLPISCPLFNTLVRWNTLFGGIQF
ncbi:hypothetical protein AVEN_63526-1 [Araneus ventricosus]|uniref:Uncharacterized protein n=1 Tax=Araneus ventricosus TaxID=182803 RepID=A0A4Y2CMV8_ARAVE|nr:hypothetical protein AVEN_63526-1 [Araneus ventricosus]